MEKIKKYVKCGRFTVAITSPEKILFPGTGKTEITKGEFVDYYIRHAAIMLPYLKNRILTMQRFPDGIAAEGFFHKDAPSYFPSFIKRVAVKKQEGGVVNYVVCNNMATLVYVANTACITFHLFLSKIDTLHIPDQMIFDLDPSHHGAQIDFKGVKKVALLLKEILIKLGLVPFVKTTGSRGLHVVVPLKREFDFDVVRACARKIAELVLELHPQLVTLEVRKEKRGTRIFLDTLRNSFTATAVAPYSVRAHPHAPVAVPVLWKELEGNVLTSSDMYTIGNVDKRLAAVGDLWKDMAKSARSLKKAVKILGIK